jgi:hypothetical protein
MILKFADISSREMFVQTVQAERPRLLRLMRLSRVLPHIQVRDVKGTDADWIANRISGIGKAYENVQMHIATE